MALPIKRYSLNLFLYNKLNLLQAKKIALTIEGDIAINAFDDSLKRYRSLITQTAHQHLFKDGLSSSPVNSAARKEKSDASDSEVKILKDFDRYITAKSMNPDSGDLSIYYTQTRAMLKKCYTCLFKYLKVLKSFLE